MKSVNNDKERRTPQYGEVSKENPESNGDLREVNRIKYNPKALTNLAQH